MAVARPRNINIRVLALVTLNIVAVLSLAYLPTPVAPPPLDLHNPNPLSPVPEGAPRSLFIEQLTWMEVRDHVGRRYSRVIIPTGGIEQNGPFVALNKHDLITKRLAVEVATRLGDTFVAPIVSFVPQGSIQPPSGHMLYPGTISLSEETFVRLLVDIGLSCATHGFKEIIILGDSGGSQTGMERAASKLTKALATSGARALYIGAFYDYAAVRALIASRNIPQHPEKFHEDLAFTAQLLAIDPSAIRYEERIKAGFTTLGGAPLTDFQMLQSLGESIITTRADETAKAIKAQVTEPKISR
jgi:creatinine amidohydrolase